MPVPFGFSIRDFIAGINLLIEAVKSFNDTHGAQADYRELGRELTGLQNALDGIKAVSINIVQAAQILEIITAVDDCRSCLDGFVQLYDKSKRLGSTPGKRWSLAMFQKRARGIQWTVCKADVAKFRIQIQQHSKNIIMLMETLQV